MKIANYPKWGELLAQMSDCRRELIPGEFEFWKTQVAGKSDVLEIGAGTGFLAIHLAPVVGKHLTLVEPEAANIGLLKTRLLPYEGLISLSIEHEYFEKYEGSEQDYIIFGYDSLPMVPEEIRSSFLKNIAKHLKIGGLFGLHLSTPQWNQKLIEKASKNNGIHFLFTHPLRPENTVQVDLEISEIESKSYVKSFYLKDGSLNESYHFKTSILDLDDIVNEAAKNGLVLKNHYSDFFGSNQIASDDAILIFEKKKN